LRCPCPYVVTIHDLIFMHQADGTWSQPFKNPFERAVAARFARRAAGILTVSAYSKTEIQNILGIAADKIEIVPNAVPAGFGPAKALAGTTF